MTSAGVPGCDLILAAIGWISAPPTPRVFAAPSTARAPPLTQQPGWLRRLETRAAEFDHLRRPAPPHRRSARARRSARRHRPEECRRCRRRGGQIRAASRPAPAPNRPHAAPVEESSEKPGRCRRCLRGRDSPHSAVVNCRRPRRLPLCRSDPARMIAANGSARQPSGSNAMRMYRMNHDGRACARPSRSLALLPAAGNQDRIRHMVRALVARQHPSSA